jgi:hypothetical protein
VLLKQQIQEFQRQQFQALQRTSGTSLFGYGTPGPITATVFLRTTTVSTTRASSAVRTAGSTVTGTFRRAKPSSKGNRNSLQLTISPSKSNLRSSAKGRAFAPACRSRNQLQRNANASRYSQPDTLLYSMTRFIKFRPASSGRHFSEV